MLENFIYSQKKSLFLEQLNAGNILDEAIVFIADTGEIWNHGTYFAGCDYDPVAFAQIQTMVAQLEANKLDSSDAENTYAKKSEIPTNLPNTYSLNWTINGTSDQYTGAASKYMTSIYAPTSSGNNAQILIGTGSAPTWSYTIPEAKRLIYDHGWGTVGDAKSALLGIWDDIGSFGVGTNISLPYNLVFNWNNEEYDITSAGSGYSMVKISGGYNGGTYGQWLLVGYGNNSQTNILTATSSSLPCSVKS